MKPLVVLAAIVLATSTACAQWDIQDSGTKASLRGIHSLGKGIAWASGTDGTVIRTEDGGFLWQHCTTPPGAEKLDFRGVQGFDENTAIVMSSGKGDLSRIYKTTDGCQTWKLVFTNPDSEGFFDAISFFVPSQDALGHSLNSSHVSGTVLGDPVGGTFALFTTENGGDTWFRRIKEKRASKGSGCKVDAFEANGGESAFAASNESLISLAGPYLLFITGGPVARIGYTDLFSLDGALCHQSTHFLTLPLIHGNASSGAFGFAAYPAIPSRDNFPDKLMIVGGDYELPNAMHHNAVFITRVGSFLRVFREPTTAPNGYRSAVAYDPSTQSWITVGPNGTDVSTDDGRNWRALKPGPGEPADADKNWNALSLPFVVGPKGRVGVLRPSALASR